MVILTLEKVILSIRNSFLKKLKELNYIPQEITIEKIRLRIG